MILNPYSAEVYETMIRGKALGVLSTFGRMATMLLGVVGVYAIDWWGGNGLYLLFFGVSAVASYSAWSMPYCTANRPIS